ncbi:MAG: transcription antitermination factor NusB [Candidatus Parcubacteria bacterium]|nr:transcription antitermination factor NusB [Candidatus Parcubacteria bacterium]
MANRHLSRSIVLQALFEWDFRDKKDESVDEILARDIEEFAPGLSDFSFIKNLTEGVVKKNQVLDSIIHEAAPEWPLDRISVIDRNILRIGLFELLFSDHSDVPPKVAINEAIELAKTFGGETSGKFVNGVLGAVYKELGEPGKDDIAKKKNQNVPREQLPVKQLVGAVVYSKHEGETYLAFVHDIFGHWTLSKGGLTEGEDKIEGVKRKIKEEIDAEIDVKEELGENEYVANNPEIGRYRKNVAYFLAEAPYIPLKLEADKGGLDDVRWFLMGDIAELNFYDDILPIITKGVKILSGEKEEK